MAAPPCTASRRRSALSTTSPGQQQPLGKRRVRTSLQATRSHVVGCNYSRSPRRSMLSMLRWRFSCACDLGCGQLRCSEGTRLTLFASRGFLVFLGVAAGCRRSALQFWAHPYGLHQHQGPHREPAGSDRAESFPHLGRRASRLFARATDPRHPSSRASVRVANHPAPESGGGARSSKVFAHGAPPPPPLRANVMAAPPGTASSRRSALCH